MKSEIANTRKILGSSVRFDLPAYLEWQGNALSSICGKFTVVVKKFTRPTPTITETIRRDFDIDQHNSQPRRLGMDDFVQLNKNSNADYCIKNVVTLELWAWSELIKCHLQ